jgi:hypothetical protein
MSSRARPLGGHAREQSAGAAVVRPMAKSPDYPYACIATNEAAQTGHIPNRERFIENDGA